MTLSAAPVRVHWLRHGRVDSHRGDIPLSEEGLREIEEAGWRLGRLLVPGEIVSILYAPTRRTQETASALYRSIAGTLTGASQVSLLDPELHEALRNPDLYVAGSRVDMVSSAEALAEQLPDVGLSTEQLAQLPFWKGFWSHPDRIGYWVSLLNPPGEDADAVARRLFTFAMSLLDLPRLQPRRYICVTHSPDMRAFLSRYLLDYDPGEPDYAETIDLDFSSNDLLTIRYREAHKEVPLL
jgi:broad specificity phosphatase PhoE